MVPMRWLVERKAGGSTLFPQPRGGVFFDRIHIVSCKLSSGYFYITRAISWMCGIALSGIFLQIRSRALLPGEVERMALAFEHDDLASAVSGLDRL
jgi:hypothetical protein